VGWLHTFSGGLLTTCGLTHLGSPCTDEGEELGLHGRYSTIPAKQYADLSEWINNEYELKVRGVVEEGYLFGNKLRMEREISSIMGRNVIRITDRITNFGNKPSPYTILYHMNFGFPLLDENAELVIDPLSTVARDKDAVRGLKEFRSFITPQAEFREQVFFHTMKGDTGGYSTVTLKNRSRGIAVSITFNIKQLPYLAEWKMMGYGEYVLGIEPANVLCKSRKELRENNSLPVLQPEEFTINTLEIAVMDT
jgi:hypothetical protein